MNLDPSIGYFELEGIPGKYFNCERYGSMSIAACTRNFKEAPDVVRRGRLQHCIGCAFGRTHAGENVGAKRGAAASSIVYRVACVRCRRDGRTEGTRLIGRLRLVRAHTICVSCYNREREVRLGANSKGARPKKWRGLFHSRAAYLDHGRAIVVEHPNPVIDRIELALTMMRLGHQTGIVWARPQAIRQHISGAS